MKAVYERPYVTVEPFAADIAVAACTSAKSIVFDCLKGPNTDTESVLNSSLIPGANCSVQAGFADYAGQTETTDDDIDVTTVYGSVSSNHSTHASNILTWTKNSVDVKQSALGSFLGWIYIGSSGRNKKGTTGWSIYDGALHFGNDYTHQNIAPVMGSISTSL